MPGQLQHEARDPQPPARRIDQLQPAARLDLLPRARAPVDHAAQHICFGRVGRLLQALACSGLAVGAYLRVEALLVLAEAVEAFLALGVVGVVWVGQVLRERCAQKMLVLEAGCAECGGGCWARRRREGARDSVLPGRGGFSVCCDGRVGDVAILLAVSDYYLVYGSGGK